MKKFSTAKILSLVFVCVMLLGAFALTAFATEGENVDIVSANVSYGNEFRIMFAVDAPEGATVKATDFEGNEIEVAPIEADEIPYQAYILTKGVSAQAIDEVITLSVEYNGKKVSKNYSVLQYVYTRTVALVNKTDKTEDELAEIDMLNALLDFAIKADIFLNKTPADSSFNAYQYVKVTGATVNGINPTGMYAPGATPFANIDAIEYDAEKYELSIKVNDAASTLDALKALVVADEAINVVVEIVEKTHVHNYTPKLTDPTCTAGGYTTFTCEECGASYIDNKTDALGHTDENGDFKCDVCSTIELPAADSVLTIEQALKLGAIAGDQYTTGKYYVTGTINNIYNTTHGNMYIEDENGNELLVYGTYSEDGSTRYDALATKPVVGDTVTLYGVLGTYSGTAQMKSGWITDHTAHTHIPNGDATCENPSSCTICDAILAEKLKHTYVDGTCSGCGEAEPTVGTNKADLDTIVSTSTSYTKSTTTSGWVAENAAVFKGGSTDSSPAFKFIGDASNRAVCLNGKTSAVGKLTSATLSGGISKLTFDYGLPFGDTKIGLSIKIIQNGEVVAENNIKNTSATKLTKYTFEWTLDEVIEGDFKIEITNTSPSNSTSNKDRTAIFNIEWTSAPAN